MPVSIHLYCVHCLVGGSVGETEGRVLSGGGLVVVSGLGSGSVEGDGEGLSGSGGGGDSGQSVGVDLDLPGSLGVFTPVVNGLDLPGLQSLAVAVLLTDLQQGGLGA